MNTDRTNTSFRGCRIRWHEYFDCFGSIRVYSCLSVDNVLRLQHCYPKFLAMIGATSGSSEARFAIAVSFGAFFANQRMPGRQRVIAAR